MAIRFECPNGHPLSSSEDRAGGFGKCPTCGAAFQVPGADEIARGLVRAEALVSFNCPAGHPMRAPARMAGEPGKCPTCGKTFRIPSGPQLNPFQAVGGGKPASGKPTGSGVKATSASASAPQDSAVELVEEGIMLDDDDSSSGEFLTSSLGKSSQVNAPTSKSGSLNSGVTSAAPGVGHYPHPPAGAPLSLPAGNGLPGGNLGTAARGADAHANVAPHPMTALFEALWDGTQRDAIVDVYYGDSERISPQHYAHELSHGQHAVFAVLEQNESHTLYLIPWDRIHRVAVREITELPPGMFD